MLTSNSSIQSEKIQSVAIQPREKTPYVYEYKYAFSVVNWKTQEVRTMKANFFHPPSPKDWKKIEDMWKKSGCVVVDHIFMGDSIPF